DSSEVTMRSPTLARVGQPSAPRHMARRYSDNLTAFSQTEGNVVMGKKLALLFATALAIGMFCSTAEAAVTELIEMVGDVASLTMADRPAVRMAIISAGACTP